jgi:transcriptional regulator with XRE-family HTH domain
MQTLAICPGGHWGATRIPKTPSTAFGARLRRLRGRRSQEWLAERGGVSASYVSQLETGKRGPDGPSLEIVERLARALDVSVAYLLGEEDPVLESLASSPKLQPRDKESFIHFYRRLTEPDESAQ